MFSLNFKDSKFNLNYKRFFLSTGVQQTECECPECPECGGEMVTRTNKKLNIVFWGCADFPNCKGNRDY